MVCLGKTISPSLLNDNFAGYKILGWWVCSFNILNIALHSLPACMVSDEKSSVIVTLVPLQVFLFLLLLFAFGFFQHFFFFFVFGFLQFDCYMLRCRFFWCLSSLVFSELPRFVVWCLSKFCRTVGHYYFKCISCFFLSPFPFGFLIMCMSHLL